MPFTAAHPSILLPFLRLRWLSATGLIAGCLSPDFENFLFLEAGHEKGHTLAGLFWFDMPLAFLIALIFHELVREPLNAGLPNFLHNRLAAHWSFPFTENLKKNWPVFMVSALIGSASHLGWDSLTHNGWAAANLSFYQSWSVRIGNINYPPFYILQQISTVLGTVFLIFYILMLPVRPMKNRSEKFTNGVWWFWPLVLLSALTIMMLRFNWKVPFNMDRHLGDLVYLAIGASLAGLVTASALVKFGRR